jgi:integrase
MKEKGLGSRVSRYCHSILNSALNQAIKWQMLSINPCYAVELPRKENREMAVLTPIEASKFLSKCRDNKHGLIFSVALVTGMRPSEYLGLQWQNVDFNNGVIRVRKTLVWKKGGGWNFGEPKTDRSCRSIPLPLALLKELKVHRIKQQKNRLKLGSAYQNFDLVFATDFGTPLNARNIDQRYFKEILKAAGLNEKLRLYDLRHTCATLLLSAGENPKVVSERLGHASVVLTLDTYTHVLPDMQKAATEKLEKMLYK